MKSRFLSILILAFTGSLLAQNIQVNRQNKTIAVTADDSVTADAEVAVLEIGFHNYAPTQESAFRENVRAAEQITKELLAAKIPKANIETEKLRLTRAEADDKWTADMKKERQFETIQSWRVTVAARDAQGVVELAVKAGANEVGDVDWNVADPGRSTGQSWRRRFGESPNSRGADGKGIRNKAGRTRVCKQPRTVCGSVWRNDTEHRVGDRRASSSPAATQADVVPAKSEKRRDGLRCVFNRVSAALAKPPCAPSLPSRRGTSPCGLPECSF